MNQAKLQSTALLIGRVLLGVVVLYYGSQKALGVFGGAGFQGTLDAMREEHHISPLFAILAIFAEFFGSLGLILGFLTRVAAFGVLCSMSVATYFSASPGELGPALLAGNLKVVNSVAYPFVLAVLAIVVLVAGAGDFSLDRKVFGRRGR